MSVPAPTRIQQRRVAGWRKPEGAVSVARPHLWGNDYVVQSPPGGEHLVWFLNGDSERFEDLESARVRAVELFRLDLLSLLDPSDVDISSKTKEGLRALRGKTLMCFCAVGTTCHADVLLDLANGPEL